MEPMDWYREWKRLNDLINPPWMAELRRIREMQDEIDRSRFAFEQMRQGLHFDSYARSFVKDALRVKAEVEQLARSLDLQRLAEDYRRMQALARDYAAIQEALAYNWAGVDDVLEAPGEADVRARQAAFDQVVDTLREMAARYPRSWLTFRLLVVIFFTIVLPLYGFVGDQVEAKRAAAWRKQADAKLEALGRVIEAQRPPVDHDLFVALGSVPVRSAPHSRSKSVGRLAANDLVELVQVSGRWALVNHFNVQTEELTQGWVYLPRMRLVE